MTNEVYSSSMHDKVKASPRHSPPRRRQAAWRPPRVHRGATGRSRGSRPIRELRARRCSQLRAYVSGDIVISESWLDGESSSGTTHGSSAAIPTISTFRSCCSGARIAGTLPHRRALQTSCTDASHAGWRRLLTAEAGRGSLPRAEVTDPAAASHRRETHLRALLTMLRRSAVRVLSVVSPVFPLVIASTAGDVAEMVDVRCGSLRGRQHQCATAGRRGCAVSSRRRCGRSGSGMVDAKR